MIFCSLYSGSSGNSIFVSSARTSVLVDAGLPGKSIEKAMKEIGQKPEELDGIFITHEHTDHTKGVGVLSRKYDIPIYANEATWQAISSTIGNIKEHNIKIFSDTEITINDMDILSFPISHDAVSPRGYTLSEGRKKVCIATDLGYFSPEVKAAAIDADVLLLESNHDIEMVKFGPYPYPLKMRILSNVGHLSNEDCGNAIVNITNGRHKKIILGHLSKTNNYPDLAYQTVVNILKENSIDLNNDIDLSMAKRDNPSSFIEF